MGEGTTFRIYFPRHVATAQEPAEAGAANAKARSARDLTGKGVVLLVEDEAPVRRFASRALGEQGLYGAPKRARRKKPLTYLATTKGPSTW